VVETTVKTLLCCGFGRTGKAMGQVYQCCWRICRETNVFSGFEYHVFCVLYTFVIYLLTLPRNIAPTVLHPNFFSLKTTKWRSSCYLRTSSNACRPEQLSQNRPVCVCMCIPFTAARQRLSKHVLAATKNCSTCSFLCGPCRIKGGSVGPSIPLSLPGNGSVRTFPWQLGIVAGVVFYAIRVVLKAKFVCASQPAVHRSP
jgi:hypothetical protein